MELIRPFKKSIDINKCYASTELTLCAIKYAKDYDIDAREVLKGTGYAPEFFTSRQNSKYPLIHDKIVNQNMKQLFGDDIGFEVGKSLIKYDCITPAQQRIIKFAGNPRNLYGMSISQAKLFTNYFFYEADFKRTYGIVRAQVIHESLLDYPDCGYDAGIYHIIPTLWDLPPAKVEETKCIQKGDHICEYFIRWQNYKHFLDLSTFLKSTFNFITTSDLEEKVEAVGTFDPNETGRHTRKVALDSIDIFDKFATMKNYNTYRKKKRENYLDLQLNVMTLENWMYH